MEPGLVVESSDRDIGLVARTFLEACGWEECFVEEEVEQEEEEEEKCGGACDDEEWGCEGAFLQKWGYAAFGHKRRGCGVALVDEERGCDDAFLDVPPNEAAASEVHMDPNLHLNPNLLGLCHHWGGGDAHAIRHCCRGHHCGRADECLDSRFADGGLLEIFCDPPNA